MDARFTAFNDACSEVVTCGCAVAGKHISKLLKTVAATPDVLAVVRAAAKRYDFATEFNRSKVPSGVGGYRLLPPARAEEFVAYAFGILLHIDLGDLDLPELLYAYFSDASGDVNAAYARFADAIPERFRRAVLNLAAGAKPLVALEDLDEIPDGENLSTLKEILSDCVARAAAADLPLPQKEELLTLCDALSRSLALCDRSAVYPLFVGFKYAFGALGGFGTHIESIANLLKRCRLI